MKKSKFTDSQIMDAIKRVEAGFTLPDICRELVISTATFYKWRAKYGGMDACEVKRLRALELENSKLKRLLPDKLSDSAWISVVAANARDLAHHDFSRDYLADQLESVLLTAVSERQI